MQSLTVPLHSSVSLTMIPGIDEEGEEKRDISSHHHASHPSVFLLLVSEILLPFLNRTYKTPYFSLELVFFYFLDGSQLLLESTLTFDITH